MIDDEMEPMADHLDRGVRNQERLNKDALAHVRREAERQAERLGRPTGYCLFCEADCPGRFCDPECGALWQREKDAMRRNGES